MANTRAKLKAILAELEADDELRLETLYLESTLSQKDAEAKVGDKLSPPTCNAQPNGV